MLENFTSWDVGMGQIPEDVVYDIGVVDVSPSEVYLSHGGESRELDWRTADTVDISGGYFERGRFKVEVKIERVDVGFHSAPLWFVSEEGIDGLMPEIDVAEAYYGRKIQTNLHFGRGYGSSTHFQIGAKNHFNLFNRLTGRMPWSFYDWITYELHWERDLEIFYNGCLVRKIRDFKSNSKIRPIISAKNGAIMARNFVYESL